MGGPQTKPFTSPMKLETTSPIDAEFAVILFPSIALAAAQEPHSGQTRCAAAPPQLHFVRIQLIDPISDGGTLGGGQRGAKGFCA